MRHSDEIVKLAEQFIFRHTLGSPRVLLGLPPKLREKCIKALAICKQAREFDHEQAKLGTTDKPAS